MNDSLGVADAKRCNGEFGSSLSLSADDLRMGCEVDLTADAAAWLSGKGPGLLQPLEVKAVPPAPAVKAPAKAKAPPAEEKDDK